MYTMEDYSAIKKKEEEEKEEKEGVEDKSWTFKVLKNKDETRKDDIRWTNPNSERQMSQVLSHQSL